MKKLLIISIAAFLVAIIIAGCASSSQTTSNRPGWVDKGSGFFSGDRGKAFYGVGAATGIRNVQLRRTTAETNARADIARAFKTKVADLVKVYMRHVSGGDPARSSEEQTAQQVTRAFTEMDLVGARVIDHFFDPADQTEYALVVMDAAGMKDQVAQMKQLSKQIQDAILKNSDDAFNELKEEEAKGKQ